LCDFADEAVKIGKEAVSNLLAPIKDVLNCLDLVSQVHPAVGVAVGIIKVRSSGFTVSIPTKTSSKVVVQLELDRLDNDKHIAGLYVSMVSDFDLLSSIYYF
jgi:hypothetical protein